MPENWRLAEAGRAGLGHRQYALGSSVQMLTDFDVDTQNAVIQMKTGSPQAYGVSFGDHRRRRGNSDKGMSRPGATIGDGGTADAIMAGFGHVIKGGERITSLGRWLNRNPTADPEDIYNANSMLQDLISAMTGEGYPGP